MYSQLVVEKYGAKLKQGLLFTDYDYILRNTSFKSINPIFDKDAIIHWWMNVYIPNGRGDEDTPYQIYSAWTDAQYKYFKYIRLSGYNPKINQCCIQFSGYKDDPIQPQIDELMMWLPHIRCDPNDNFKYVGVFEHTLSEHGVYDLRIYSDKCVIGKTTWGSCREIHSFNSLEETIKLIVKKYYYE